MGPFFLIFLWKWKSDSPAALPPHWLSLHSGLLPSVFHQALTGGLRVGFLPFPSLPFSPSDGKYGPGSCELREARVPPVGIVSEGNLREAPSRRFPGICPDRGKSVSAHRAGECCGLWRVGILAGFVEGWVWSPFSLLGFLGFRLAWRLGAFSPALASQQGSRGVAK